MVKITIIGGGSSTFTPTLMRLFIESEVLSGSTITLMDIDARRLKIMDSLSKQLVKKSGADLKIESTTEQRESLVDADFVITAIAVGGVDAWEKDIEIPARYGVFMPVQDSIGPGGIMRAFRHIPVLVSVGKDLEEVSPDALIFNYTNPVTANTMAMNRCTKIKAFGLCSCSSIPSDADYLGRILGVNADELAIPPLVGGLNHCTAILELRLKDGRDAFELLKKRGGIAEGWWGATFQNFIFENYGILPYCPSHWTEFFPSVCQLAEDEEYKGRAQGLKLISGGHIHDMDRYKERVKRWEVLVEEISRGEGKEVSLDVLPKGEGIIVVKVIEAFLENRNEIHVVNVENKGAISNLPNDAIVEVSCVVGRYGIKPIHVGPLPKLAAKLRSHIVAQELTVEAAVTGDRQIAYEAFLQDPNITARLTPEETEKLLNEMLEAHAAYLPQFK